MSASSDPQQPIKKPGKRAIDPLDWIRNASAKQLEQHVALFPNGVVANLMKGKKR